MSKRGKLVLIIIGLLVVILTTLLLINNYNARKNEEKRLEQEIRYNEIRASINKEMERYIYVVYPVCEPDGATPIITHKDLVYNAGMDKDEFLDVDKKSYCKAYVKPKCIETGKWEWDTFISCKDYTDEGYVNWENAFEAKE